MGSKMGSERFFNDETVGKKTLAPLAPFLPFIRSLAILAFFNEDKRMPKPEQIKLVVES
jgi:hypothetical protein